MPRASHFAAQVFAAPVNAISRAWEDSRAPDLAHQYRCTWPTRRRRGGTAQRSLEIARCSLSRRRRSLSRGSLRRGLRRGSRCWLGRLSGRARHGAPAWCSHLLLPHECSISNRKLQPP